MEPALRQMNLDAVSRCNLRSTSQHGAAAFVKTYAVAACQDGKRRKVLQTVMQCSQAPAAVNLKLIQLTSDAFGEPLNVAAIGSEGAVGGPMKEGLSDHIQAQTPVAHFLVDATM